jgi:hypothetical protein
MVFHHQQPGAQEAPPLRTDRCELNHKDKSLRKHIGGMFHRTKRQRKEEDREPDDGERAIEEEARRRNAALSWQAECGRQV